MQAKDNYQFKPSTDYNFHEMERGIHEIIGSNLAEGRKAHGLSGEYVSKVIGIGQSTYNSYEKGKVLIPSHLGIAWSIVTSVSPYFLSKGTAYEGISPFECKNVDMMLLHSYIAQQSLEEMEVFIRDVCVFSNQVSPSFEALENKYRAIGLNIKEEALHEICSDYYYYIAGNVKKIRLDNGLSQVEMAELLQVSLHVYRGIENEKQPRGFSFVTAFRWMLATGISTTVLFKQSKYFAYRCYIEERLNIVNSVFKNINHDCVSEVIDYVKALSKLKSIVS